jgi:hypothetical protein
MSDGSWTELGLSYGASDLEIGPSGAHLRLACDGGRPLRLSASPRNPGVFRDALLAVGDVLQSDLRFKARDRADYLAYLLAQNKGVSKAVWDAQREFLALKYDEAARAEEPLDPIVSLGPDALRLEVLSKDESSYALLTLPRSAFSTLSGELGASYLDLTSALMRSVSRLRTWRPTTVDIGVGSGDPLVRDRRVPYRWLRAFGQMGAASLLPAAVVDLAPIDLYNVLHVLRMRKAKKAPRALRYELVPGERARLVIEPWDLVIESQGAPYAGPRPLIVRTYGRNRLAGIARVLPHASSLRVHLLGPGLPAFYVASLEGCTLTLGLSGWTDSGWAGVSTFDLLAADGATLGPRIQEVLTKETASLDGLASALGAPRADVRRAALGEVADLRAGHDVATGALFSRSLLAKPLPPGALRFRDAREEQAHRLLATPGQVSLTKLADTPEGRQVEGLVEDKQARRSFRPAFTVDAEGGTGGATCACPLFRRAGVREGPCEHLIALRVAYDREQARLEAARGTEAGRKLIRAETRTFFRRTPRGTEVHRLSLDGREVVSKYGTGEPTRRQRLLFPTEIEARDAYFQRVDELVARQWLDGGANG